MYAHVALDARLGLELQLAWSDIPYMYLRMYRFAYVVLKDW